MLGALVKKKKKKQEQSSTLPLKHLHCVSIERDTWFKWEWSTRIKNGSSKDKAERMIGLAKSVGKIILKVST